MNSIIQRYFTSDVTVQDGSGNFIVKNRQELQNYILNHNNNNQQVMVVDHLWNFLSHGHHHDPNNHGFVVPTTTSDQTNVNDVVVVDDEIPLISWQAHSSIVEPNYFDDMVWIGNLQISPLSLVTETTGSTTTSMGGTTNTRPLLGRYIFIRFTGQQQQRGGFTLQGYDPLKRGTIHNNPLLSTSSQWTTTSSTTTKNRSFCYKPVIYGMILLNEIQSKK